MSTAAKVTLAATSLTAIGIVIFVHQQQKSDQAVSPGDLGFRPTHGRLHYHALLTL